MLMTQTSKPMTSSQRFAQYAIKKSTSKALAYYFYVLGVLAAFVAAGVLVAAEAKTKPTGPYGAQCLTIKKGAACAHFY